MWGSAWHYLTILCSTRQYLAILDNTWRYLTILGNTGQHWALGAAQCANYYGRSCCTTQSDLLANPSFVKLRNNSFNFQRYCRGTFTKSYKKTIGVDFLEKQLRVQSEEVSALVLTQVFLFLENLNNIFCKDRFLSHC